MSVTCESRTSHGLYGASVITCIRVSSIVDEVWKDGGAGDSGAWAIQSLCDEYVLEVTGMEDFIAAGEDITEEDALVILSSFAPGGSEWGSAPHNLQDVQRFWDTVRKMAEGVYEEACAYEDERIRQAESSACNQARGGW